jgi:hypothetical protein
VHTGSSEVAIAVRFRGTSRRHADVLLANVIEAENALIANGELRGNDLKELDDALFRCVVFGWTCSIFKV